MKYKAILHIPCLLMLLMNLHIYLRLNYITRCDSSQIAAAATYYNYISPSPLLHKWKQVFLYNLSSSFRLTGRAVLTSQISSQSITHRRVYFLTSRQLREKKFSKKNCAEIKIRDFISSIIWSNFMAPNVTAVIKYAWNKYKKCDDSTLCTIK